jgi:hypothetical protein
MKKGKEEVDLLPRHMKKWGIGLVTLVKSKLHHKINAFLLTITQWLTTMFDRYVTFILKSGKRSGNYDVFSYGGATHLY